MAPMIVVPCGHDWKGAGKYYLHQPYVDCLLEAGGTPLLTVHMDRNRIADIMACARGVLLPGGIDIDAALFDEEPHPQCGEINPVWDQLDMMVIAEALERKLPILAICRGIQILNIAAGGSIIQDIPSQVNRPLKHMQEAPRWHGSHNVRLKAGSVLSSLFSGDQVAVNSFHHQAVGRVAPDFEAVAFSSDGVIEAVERQSGSFALGVQWHPELMVSHHPSMRRLFALLLEHAHLLRKERR